MYHGEIVTNINLAGLSHVISISHAPIPSTSNPLNPASTSNKRVATLVDGPDLSSESLPLIHFRVYSVKLYKSGQREPRVELTETGPSFDFKLRRHLTPSEDHWKKATKKKMHSNETKKRKNVNIDVDEMGDKVGRIHVGRQDLSKLQSRKVKGLKMVREEDSDEDGIDEQCSVSEIEIFDDVGGNEPDPPPKRTKSGV